MSKSLMTAWMIVIFLLLSLVLVIGLNEKDLTYLKLEYNIKKTTKSYIKSNNIDIKFNANDLIDIDEISSNSDLNDKLLKKYCIKSVTVHKGLFYEYVINKQCEK